MMHEESKSYLVKKKKKEEKGGGGEVEDKGNLKEVELSKVYDLNPVIF